MKKNTDSILHALYHDSREQLFGDILSLYKKQGYAIISFLYFANLMKRRLIEGTPRKDQQIYKQALLDADFLLMDGIALQIFHYLSTGRKKRIDNMNGTDLTPNLLNRLNQKKEKFSLIFYGGTQEANSKACKKLEEMGYIISYQQDGYSDFDWKTFEKTHQAKKEKNLKIFLIARGSPRQELRVQKHKDKVKKNGLLVMNVGGLVDFLSGEEIRAPQWMIKFRVFETFWRICKAPRDKRIKNLNKFLAMFGIVRYRVWRLKNKLTSIQ